MTKLHHWSEAPHAFYLDPAEWRAPFTLKESEARHLSQVLRIKPGETVKLLDGDGREGLFKVLRAGKNNVELNLLEEIIHPPPEARAIMAIAWTKALRRGYFMEKAVELGAWGIWFWQAERSQGKIPADGEKNWLGQLAAGAKQCGNPFIPHVAVFTGLRELITAADGLDRRIVLWEEAAFSPLIASEQLGQKGDTLYVIGPEGGIAEGEITAMRDGGFAVANLGDLVFRCETAASYCLALHHFYSRRNS